MRYILIVLSLCLTACSTTVPVVVKFPNVPGSLMEKCPGLITIDKQDNVSIVDLEKNVIVNYTTYYECANKVENWIEWYNDQKKIFDKVNK